MAKSLEQIQACKLRVQGESVKQIAKILGVSSGSVSKWTRNVPLTETQRALLRERQIAAGNRGRMMGVERNKEKKAVRIRLAGHEAKERIPSLSRDQLFYVGLGLYWGEGVKAESSSSLAIINSDARVITLMMRWFTECFGIERDRFMPRVFISDTHRDREEIITQYWVKTLGIPQQQFRRMIFLDKGKKIYESRDVYYGVLALRVSKGTDIRYKILAQIARIAELGVKNT